MYCISSCYGNGVYNIMFVPLSVPVYSGNQYGQGVLFVDHNSMHCVCMCATLIAICQPHTTLACTHTERSPHTQRGHHTHREVTTHTERSPHTGLKHCTFLASTGHEVSSLLALVVASCSNCLSCPAFLLENTLLGGGGGGGGRVD